MIIMLNLYQAKAVNHIWEQEYKLNRWEISSSPGISFLEQQQQPHSWSAMPSPQTSVLLQDCHGLDLPSSPRISTVVRLLRVHDEWGKVGAGGGNWGWVSQPLVFPSESNAPQRLLHSHPLYVLSEPSILPGACLASTMEPQYLCWKAFPFWSNPVASREHCPPHSILVSHILNPPSV